jgi:hypothetical protein
MVVAAIINDGRRRVVTAAIVTITISIGIVGIIVLEQLSTSRRQAPIVRGSSRGSSMGQIIIAVAIMAIRVTIVSKIVADSTRCIKAVKWDRLATTCVQRPSETTPFVIVIEMVISIRAHRMAGSLTAAQLGIMRIPHCVRVGIAVGARASATRRQQR